jgi:hypothetical protein
MRIPYSDQLFSPCQKACAVLEPGSSGPQYRAPASADNINVQFISGPYDARVRQEIALSGTGIYLKVQIHINIEQLCDADVLLCEARRELHGI